jgi:hypothetical protein
MEDQTEINTCLNSLISVIVELFILIINDKEIKGLQSNPDTAVGKLTP